MEYIIAVNLWYVACPFQKSLYVLCLFNLPCGLSFGQKEFALHKTQLVMDVKLTHKSPHTSAVEPVVCECIVSWRGCCFAQLTLNASGSCGQSV